MEHSTNTKLASVLMAVNKLGDKTLGILMHPIVMWASVQLFLIVAKIHGLKSKSIDFLIAFLKADLDILV
jgi:hypothetical protein